MHKIDWKLSRNKEQPEVYNFQGHYNKLDLYLKTEKQAHDIAKITGAETYRILFISDSDREKVVYQTKDITAWEKQQEIDIKQHELNVDAKVKSINKLPVWTEIENPINNSKLRIFVHRSKAEKPSWRGDYAYTRVYVTEDGKLPKKDDREFHYNQYVTKNKRILFKKFIEWSGYGDIIGKNERNIKVFKEWNGKANVIKNNVKNIKAFLNAIIEGEEKVKQQIENAK